jgi:hypothetical protein
MVIAPNANEEWTERTTKQAREKAIMEHHVRKYSLTHTTPPMRMPILRKDHQQEREYWMVLTHQPQAQTDTADCFKNSFNR